MIAFSFLILTVPAAAQTVKHAEFSGSWYPANPKALAADIDSYLKNAGTQPISGQILGIISPHAGYMYSAPVAAYGFAALAAQKNIQYDAIIVMGPSHQYAFDGISVFPEGTFQIPLGNLEINSDIAAQLQSLDFVKAKPEYFSGEHSLEAQLPFIRAIFSQNKIVPVLFGRLNYNQLLEFGKKLAEISDGKKILVIASSDMSHYQTYADAKEIDANTIEHVKNYDTNTLWLTQDYGSGRACGIEPIISLLAYAQNKNAAIKILKYANSGDTTGDKSKVVGYFSAAVYLPDNQEADQSAAKEQGGNMNEFSLNDEEKKYLLKLARSTLETFLKTGKQPKPEKPTSVALKSQRGAFVTLTENGELRGCIGRIVGDTPLYQVVAEFAINAAVSDPRFPPVRYDELKNIEIEISVLTPFTKVNNLDEITVGKHGLMIRKGFYSGLLLPQVPGEWGWDKKTFLEQTCHKAGLPPESYKDKDAVLEKFSAIIFNEADWR